MPGRSFAREQAQHAAAAPQQFRSLHALLTEYLPEHDRALVGQDAILAYLGDVLCLRRPNGSRLTWRIILRWRANEDFPLLRGGWNSWSRCLAPCLSTAHAVTAWTLTRFDAAKRRALFAVGTPTGFVPVGKAPKEFGSDAIARRYRERRARRPPITLHELGAPRRGANYEQMGEARSRGLGKAQRT